MRTIIGYTSDGRPIKLRCIVRDKKSYYCSCGFGTDDWYLIEAHVLRKRASGHPEHTIDITQFDEKDLTGRN